MVVLLVDLSAGVKASE
jgi:hypothetical protein